MSLSLVKFNEYISPNSVRIGKFAEIQVDPNLSERRIFLFVDTITTGDFSLFGSVVCRDTANNVVAEFDASLYSQASNQLILPKSVPNLFAAGGSAVGDSCIVQLALPFNALLPTIVLQPLRVNLQISSLVYQIEGVSGLISGFRVWLGCLSTLI